MNRDVNSAARDSVMTTEVARSSVAECDESATLPRCPGFAEVVQTEHEYGLLPVGPPHSASRETEGEMKSRWFAQCIAQPTARLLQGN